MSCRISFFYGKRVWCSFVVSGRYIKLICFKRLLTALSSFVIINVHFNVICMLDAQFKLHDKMSFGVHTKSHTVGEMNANYNWLSHILLLMHRKFTNMFSLVILHFNYPAHTLIIIFIILFFVSLLQRK